MRPVTSNALFPYFVIEMGHFLEAVEYENLRLPTCLQITNFNHSAIKTTFITHLVVTMDTSSGPSTLSAESSLKRSRILFTNTNASSANSHTAIAASSILPPLHDPILHKASVLRKMRMRGLVFDPREDIDMGKSGSSSTMKVITELRNEAFNLQGLAASSTKSKKKRSSNSTAIVATSSTSTASLEGLSGIRTSDAKGTLIVHRKSDNHDDPATPSSNNNSNNHILALPSTKKRILTKSSTSTKIPTPKWHAPWRLSSVISSHLGWVRSVAFDPTNDMFATGGADRVIKIFDLAKASVGREDALKITLTGHVGPVRGLAFSERQPYLFSAGEDKQVKVSQKLWFSINRFHFFVYDFHFIHSRNKKSFHLFTCIFIMNQVLGFRNKSGSSTLPWAFIRSFLSETSSNA